MRINWFLDIIIWIDAGEQVVKKLLVLCVSMRLSAINE